MTLLIIGLALWSVAHLMASIGLDIKQLWISRLGENSYSLLAAVLIAGSLVLIVLGWRSAAAVTVYNPLESLRPVTLLLMVLAIMLFVASSHASRIKRIIQHPQLTGVIAWSAGHLIQNGDTRSIALFGWLGIWAILEIIFINRRDGEWVKEAPPSWAIEARYFAISFVVFVGVVFLHPYISGVSIL
jgi:uncharacterized membrane protein